MTDYSKESWELDIGFGPGNLSWPSHWQREAVHFDGRTGIATVTRGGKVMQIPTDNPPKHAGIDHH